MKSVATPTGGKANETEAAERGEAFDEGGVGESDAESCGDDDDVDDGGAEATLGLKEVVTCTVGAVIDLG